MYALYVPTKRAFVLSNVLLATYGDTKRPQNQLNARVVVRYFKSDVRLRTNVEPSPPQYELNMVNCRHASA